MWAGIASTRGLSGACIAVLLSGCALPAGQWTDREWTAAEAAYQLGRDDGCRAGALAARGFLADREAYRYHADADYRAGWDAGYHHCLYLERRHFFVHEPPVDRPAAKKPGEAPGADRVRDVIERERNQSSRSRPSEKTGEGDRRRESEKSGAGHGAGGGGRGPN